MTNETINTLVRNDILDSFKARVTKVGLLDATGSVISGQIRDLSAEAAWIAWTKNANGASTSITLVDAAKDFPSAGAGGVTAHGVGLLNASDDVRIAKAFAEPLVIAEGQNATLPATFKLTATFSPHA